MDTEYSDKNKKPEGKGWVWDAENEKWFRIRKLTPRECLRLMGVRDNDIDKLMKTETIVRKDGTTEEKQLISNSQLYKLAGNSIVVDVMYHMFKNLFIDEKKAEAVNDRPNAQLERKAKEMALQYAEGKFLDDLDIEQLKCLLVEFGKQCRDEDRTDRRG